MAATPILLARFWIVGLFNTVSALLLIYAFKAFAGLDDIAANALGYSFGLIFGFVTHRRLTFQAQGAWKRQFVTYALVVPLAYPLNLFTVIALIRWGEVDPHLAHALGVLPYAATVFLASKWLFMGRVSDPVLLVRKSRSRQSSRFSDG